MTAGLPSDLAFYYVIGCVSVFVCSVVAFVIVRAGAVPFRPQAMRRVAAGVLMFSLYLPICQYLKYSSLHMFVDISHWLQLLHSIVQTGKPESLNTELMVPGTLNYLSAHFVPFVYVMAVPFAMVPRVETLMSLNYLVMMSAVVPLYKLVRHFGHPRETAWFFVVLLVGYPTFQYIVLYEFEMLRFSIPALLWLLYFWERRRVVAYWAALVTAALVREDVGLTLAMFGVYVVLFEDRKREGLLTVVAGVSAFMIISQMIMPALSAGQGYEHVAASIFSHFGRTPGEALRGVITQPAVVLSTIAQPVKLANLFMMFLPLVFLPLLAPAVLVSTLANVGIGLLSSSFTHTSYMLYYLSPTVPFLMYAAAKGWSKVAHVSGAVMAAVLAGLLAANVCFGPSPLSLQFWFRDVRPAPFRSQNFHRSAYDVAEHHRTATMLIEQIPDAAIVSTQQFLHARLFRKKAAMVFPQVQSLDRLVKADYVLLDFTNNGLSSESPAFVSAEQIGIVVNDSNAWRPVAVMDGYHLFKRAEH